MSRWWRGGRKQEPQARRLYQLASEWSREPHLYTSLSVADTIDGRVAMLLLHLTILIDRLGRSGESGRNMALGVTEAFVAHMDDTFRHIGVGDLAVPRKVKKAAAALYDAHGDYGRALVAGNDAPSAWRHALHLHLVSRGAAPSADIVGLAEHAQALAAKLAAIEDAEVLNGVIGAIAVR